MFAGYKILVSQFFSFSANKMPCPCLLVLVVSDEKSVVIQIVVPLYIMCHFSLAAFDIFFFSFNQFMTCLKVNFFGFILF